MAEKVAITVAPDLLRRVESLRRKTRESRSAVFARAVRLLLTEEERRQRIERYVAAYRERPESEPEIGEAEALAKLSLQAVEWQE